LFRKWAVEDTLLACTFESDLFSSIFRGRLGVLNDAEAVKGASSLRLFSDDGTAELSVALLPDLEFWYGDSRDSEEREPLVGAVCFSRPAPADVEDHGVMRLSELPENVISFPGSKLRT